MKNLIINSAKICRSVVPITNSKSLFLSKLALFSTAKVDSLSHKKTVQGLNNSVNVPSISSQRQNIQVQALKIINEYMTIDEIKSQPGAIKEHIMKLIKVFEYDRDCNAKRFYIANKEKLDKIVYDLRSHNCESIMSLKQILLTFYLCKLAIDCGYNHKVQGFELRGTIKLTNSIAKKYRDENMTSDLLSVNQTIYGYWLTSQIHCINHEYKWKTFQMMLNQWGNWKKQTSYKNTQSGQIQSQIHKSNPPFTFSQISALLEAYYTQELHMSSEYEVLEFLINNIYFNRSYYLTKEQFEKNETLFIETFSYLIGIQQHLISGKSFFQLQDIVNEMSKIVQNHLFKNISIDRQSFKTFIDNKDSNEFQSKSYFEDKLKANKKLDSDKRITQIWKLTQQEVYRYFIFLNQIRENKLFFKNLSNHHYKKLQFVLFQTLQAYFASLSQKSQQFSLQMLSLHIRTWIRKKQYQLQELQHSLQKAQSNELKTKMIQDLLKKIITEFSQTINFLTQKLEQQLTQIAGEPRKKSNKKIYLTAQQKEIQEQKNSFIRNVEISFIKPLIDFIFANGKQTIMNTSLIGSQKLAIIQILEDFLTKFYGDKVQLSTDKNIKQTTKTLTIQNSYFWMLKYMRLQSVNVVQNKLLLKQFESLLLEQIVKNVVSKNPRPYSIISIYNLYAYMCKIQQKMMQNHVRKETSNGNQENLEIEPFHKKKEYQYFLTYKNYLSKLIFKRKGEQSTNLKQQKEIQIPKKLQIDSLFMNSFQSIEKQKIGNLSHQFYLKKQTQLFNIELFFNIVFRENRYYNHKILSQETLLYLFGTKELLSSSIMDKIANTNQRSGQNFYELIYMMLLASNQEYSHNVELNLSLKTIKVMVIQAIHEKTKGSLLVDILRNIVAPRKISFMKATPLKYRQKPYSIFQTVSRQPQERKQQIVNDFFTHFNPSRSQLFCWIEMVLLNLDVWGQDRSQIISSVILPWLTSRIESEDVIKPTIFHFLICVLRLLRFEMTGTNPSNQKYFMKFISNFLPNQFLNVERNKKEHAYMKRIGLLVEIEKMSRLAKFHPERLNRILLKCKQNLDNTGNSENISEQEETRYFKRLSQMLDKVIELNQKDMTSKKEEEESKSKRIFKSQNRKPTQEKIKKGGMFGRKNTLLKI